MRYIKSQLTYYLLTLYLVTYTACDDECLCWCEVVGCPDVSAPPGGWAIRNDDSTSTLGCNQHDDVMMTSRTWQLVCVGHAWRGVTHNCTMISYQHGTVPYVVTCQN